MKQSFKLLPFIAPNYEWECILVIEKLDGSKESMILTKEQFNQLKEEVYTADASEL